MSTKERFRRLDRYRVEREWKRYEGTAQRDLFRELRERFLTRHRKSGGRSLEIGPGPGRFTLLVGGEGTHRILLDLSLEALRTARANLASTSSPSAPLSIIRGDAGEPPFRDRSFRTVSLLGNALGFAGEAWESLLTRAVGLVEPQGTVLLEIAPGAGEWSRYLARLPPGAVARLLRAPVPLIVPRVEGEGFASKQPSKKTPTRFRRISVSDAERVLGICGARVDEVLSVAPALGGQPERVEASRGDPKGWKHLLELEEQLGGQRARHVRGAAVLIAATVATRAPPSR